MKRKRYSSPEMGRALAAAKERGRRLRRARVIDRERLRRPFTI
jgi:hypothetical protein